MKQPMSDTCAIVACTVALEGMHRKVYEESNGVGTFPAAWQAAGSWNEQLRLACERKGVWKAREGANVGDVLIKIQELAGVVTSVPGLLMPLLRWEKHSSGLTRERVAELIDLGPCIGRLWVCPWYHHFNADNGWVYRGCGRDKHARDECKELYEDKVMGSHAVVCLAYRFWEEGEEMHVLVLDNHDDDGPQRWIDVEELDAIFTLSVECLTNEDVSPTKALFG
uniref:Uncharacterized protein n=1 Tax=Oryza glumipatula TaxID=40148 RepID=A0A0E0AJW4_9ORYZ